MEIQELLFTESSDDDDDVKAEVMYDSDSDINYILEPSNDDNDDEDNSDGIEPSTSSPKRKKKPRHVSGRPTTRQMAAHDLLPLRLLPILLSRATCLAVPATSHVGPRGKRRCHEDDDVSPSVRFQMSSYRKTYGFQWSRQQPPGQPHGTSCLLCPPQEASNADTPERCFKLFSRTR